MLIREVTDPGAQKLYALSQLLRGRMKDESAKQPINVNTFVELARSLGVNVTAETLPDLVTQEPLSNILAPIEPGSPVIRFKDDAPAAAGMSVDQAQAVVNSNAKSAMRRRQ